MSRVLPFPLTLENWHRQNENLFRRLDEQRAAPYGTADIIGLPDDLTPSDLADLADTIDCVGVFDSDRDEIDEAARRHVEGVRAALTGGSNGN